MPYIMILKHYLITFLLIFIVRDGLCQSYQPFDFENGNWLCYYYKKGGMFGGGHGTYYAKDSVNFYCNGDTIIGENKYKKVYYSGYTSSQIVERTYIHGYYGAIRNNIDNKQVLFIYKDTHNANEKILYDFNIKLGDSLQVSCMLDDEKEPIVLIDSVIYCNQYHRCYVTSSGFRLTEGIGNDDGLFAISCMTYIGSLLCYSETEISGSDSSNFFT